jgi:predicted nucleic acid-binding protein
MNRVFLDANVLFSAAWRENTGLTPLWQLKETELVTSHYASEEARRNLESDSQRKRLTRLMGDVELVSDVLQGDLPLGVSLPEKDRPILLAAIRARATHLLTGDKQHFARLYGKP